MKISELRARESFDACLERTVQQGMALYPEYVDRNASELWFEHPYFSVYVTRGFCADGRRYLKNQYRYAPKLSRRLFQAPAVELLGTVPVFERMLKPAFETCGCANASSLMWMPGNHRFRLFDFGRRNVCVFPKYGFSTDGIEKEIEFRMKHAEEFGWMIPIDKADEGRVSFVEPLLETHPLDREFSARRRRLALEQAAHALKELHGIDSGLISAANYLCRKLEQYDAAKMRVKSMFPGFCPDCVDRVWQKVASVIERAGEVEVCLTHGDFQPGNVLIPSGDDGRIWLIDWEDAAIRARCYDAMTWALKSRFPVGLGRRICRFSGLENSLFGEEKMPRDLLVALWAAEELIWRLEATSRPGITRLSPEIGQILRELEEIHFW